MIKILPIENKKIIQFIFLILVSVTFMYFTPIMVQKVYLILTLGLFFLNKAENDYFWIVFVLLFVDNPTNLFFQQTIYIFTFGPLKLSFLNLFTITAVLKIIFFRNKYSLPKIFFKKPLILYILWLIILLLIGLSFGIGGGGKSGFRYIYYYSLTFLVFPIFYVLFTMIKSQKDVENILSLLFIVLFINFFGQIYNIINTESLHTTLGGSMRIGSDDTTISKGIELVRPLFGAYAICLSYIFSIYLYFNSNKMFNKKLLLYVFFLSFISVFITATRGWAIAFSFFLIMISLTYFNKKILNYFRILIGILLLFILLINISPIIKSHTKKITERYLTLELLLQGDVTAGGTNSRLTTRQDPVLEKFRESPIIGWGFSRTGMEYADNHVGNQTLLMFSGIIGFCIVIYVLIFMISKIYSMQKKQNNKSGLILIYSILLLIIIHSSSTQVFGYFRYVLDNGRVALWIAIYLSILNVSYYQLKKEQIS